MPRSTRGGRLKPVKVISDSDLISGGGQYKLGSHRAVPVRGITTLERGIEGGLASAVYIVSDEQVNSGEFEIVGGPADPVINIVNMPYTPKEQGGRVATPVYALNGLSVDESSTLLNDLVAYWRLDEDDSEARVDLIGGLSLPDNNDVPQVVGRDNNAADFNNSFSHTLGPNDTDIVSLQGTGFTVAFWVKMPATQSNGRVLLKMDSGGPYEWQLLTWSSGGQKFRFYVYDSEVTSNDVISENTTIKMWNLVFLRYNPETNKIGIKVNDGSWIETTLTITPLTDTGTGFWIGSSYGTGNYFRGSLDELAIWHRILTSDEESELWNDGKTLTHQFVDNWPTLPTSFSKLATTVVNDWVAVVMLKPNGDIHYVIREGTGHIDNDSEIVQRVSTDGGSSFARSEIYDIADRDDRNIGGGRIPATGTMVLFWREYESGPSTSHDLHYIRSTDGGDTWDYEGTIDTSGLDAWACYGEIIELPSGALLKLFIGYADPNRSAFILKSTDDGETWGNKVTIYDSADNRFEPWLVKLDGDTDGTTRLLVYVRASNEVWRSSDGGATWGLLGSLDGNYYQLNYDTMWSARVWGDYLILVTTRDANKMWGHVAKKDSAFEDVAAYSPSQELYAATGDFGDFGFQIPFIYNGQVHIQFADALSGEVPDIYHSL